MNAISTRWARRASVMTMVVTTTILLAAGSQIEAADRLSEQLRVSGANQGGVAWADYDSDSCLDLALSGANGLALYHQERLSNGRCSGTFNLARDFQDGTYYSVVWGDFDADGRPDLAANDADTIIIYHNTSGLAADFDVASRLTAAGTEGLAWIDYDEDQDLDLVTDLNDGGIRVYCNVNRAIDGRTCMDITGSQGEQARGDYLAVADYDIDGDVDLYMRRDGSSQSPEQADLWVNQGRGQFTPDYRVNHSAPENDKGGAVFCDLDNDGDLDLVRTNGGPVRAYRQEGIGSGRLSGEWNFSGRYNSVACGDIDNDGDQDVFFAGPAPGDDALFINDGDMQFQQDNRSIRDNSDGRGVAFADYDRDGDLDLFINGANGQSELWENLQNDGQALQVTLRTGAQGRLAVGATAQLLNCEQAPVSGAREVNGGMGYGSQGSPVLHFGLRRVAAARLIVRARFVGGREVMVAVRPEDTPYLTVSSTDSNDFSECQGNALDSDGDGIRDTVDLDDDNDGIPDALELGDSDGDGVPDRLDLDSDNDSVYDIVESGAPFAELDQDGDGRIDSQFPVGDNGIADVIETSPDSGVIDYNGDGQGDSLQDTDGDGIPDVRDPDSDGDGNSDITSNGNIDGDDNGQVDDFIDNNGDGVDDRLPVPNPPRDENGDGIPDNIQGRPVTPTGDPNDDGNAGGQLDTGIQGAGGFSFAWLAMLVSFLFGRRFVIGLCSKRISAQFSRRKSIIRSER